MTDPTDYRTNRDLFSNYYLKDHLRDTEPWNEVSDDEIRDVYEEVRDLYEDKRNRVDDYNEAQLERNFIRPIFEVLGIPFEIEETVMRNARRPDYGFFPSEEAADAAFDRENFYQEAIAVADAKRWGRKLDTRGEEKRDFENPSYQIHRYLQDTPSEWAVLTNGEKWRIYYEPTSHRLDSYYEIDLPELLDVVDDEGDLEAFKEFYLFFRQEAFLADQTGDCFLDDVYDESSVFAQELGEDLQENIYEAIRVLAEGFLDTNEELDQGDLDLIHDSSLIYLYRLIFVLYAESEGRDLLPTDNEIYSESYSLNELKQTVVENRDATQQHYQSWQTDLWDRLDELFVLIDQGSKGQGIPKDDLYIPAYNGGLFRTEPGDDDTVESQFLANYEVGDAYIAEVIELLTRHEADEGKGKVFVDYSSLDERNLGSIYEGLLEYKLDVADEPLTVDDGEYTTADQDDHVTVEKGEVYLRTDDGERKATGSYYTPEYVVEYIVDETLGPLIDEIEEDLVAQSARGDERGFAEEFADRVFDLTVLDPAMGSGHFPVNAVDYLAREIINAQEKVDRQALDSEDAEIRPPTTEEGELRDINWARRKVAQRCIYGVDVNPLATELSKVSLWLRTLAAEQPLAFLDHHLKTGNSLVGSDIEEVLSDGDDDMTEGGQLTLQESFEHTRQRAMEHVTDQFQDLLNIDNETLEDAKEMEAVYDEIRDDPLYQKLLAMANVHTADAFGLDVPDDADERMARALHSEAWENIEEQDWFKSAQAMAEEEHFFHWELEFPTAFYDQDGERKECAGFDAVIGNPPYLAGREWGPELRKYRPLFREQYSCMSDQYDLFALFIQKGVNLSRDNGGFGYITPNTWLNNSHYEDLRNWILENVEIRGIGDFRSVNVFPDATVLPIVFNAVKKDPQEPDLYIDEFNSSTEKDRKWSTSDAWQLFDSSVFSLSIRKDDFSLLKKIDKASDDLCVHAKSKFGVKVYQKGKGTPPQTGEEAEEDVFRSSTKDGEDYYPYVRGRDVDAWSVDYGHRWLKYGQHLAEPRNIELFSGDRIFVRRIVGPRLILSPISETIIADQLLHTVKPTSGQINNSSLAALLRSRLTAYYFKKRFNRDEETFPEIRVSELESLPVLTISGESTDMKEYRSILEDGLENRTEAGAILDDLVKNGLDVQEESDNLAAFLDLVTVEIKDMTEERSVLVLDLLDYLGNYTKGPNLPDVGLFKPTGSNILNATTEEYEKLQIERARTERDGSTVTIEATARYKPEDEDEFETDTYGYTETEFFEAFTLTGLSEEEAALAEAFVPVAVDEEIGGFRDNATKNNSLIDRLKGIILPDPYDVADDLQRYIETKERADELDEKIEKTDQLIDEIVYNLYDLTDEEVEIVEQAVEDD